MLKAKTLIIVSICASLLVSGCQPIRPQGIDRQEGLERQGIDRFGGATTQKYGKGTRSLYQNYTVEEGGTDASKRSVFPFGLNRRRGMDQNILLGRGDEPGTRMGRDQIPFGYVERSARDPFVIQSGYGASTYIDRQVLADMIAQIVVGLPDVDESAVLITDQDCIIGYTSNQAGDDIQNQVELAGLSATPRWFKVYATENRQLLDQVTNAVQDHRGPAKREILEREVDQIIRQLGGPKNSWEQPQAPNMNNHTNQGN